MSRKTFAEKYMDKKNILHCKKEEKLYKKSQINSIYIYKSVLKKRTIVIA